MVVRVTRAQVNSWRLARHHLIERAPKTKLADVVGDVCGVHAQLMSAAELSIAARVDSIAPDDVQEALWKRRSLVKTWCMRGTLHLIPASEFPTYIAALKTRTGYRSKSWLKFYRLNLDEIEGLISRVWDALEGRQLTRQELAAEISKGMRPNIRRELSSGWGSLLKPAAYQGKLIVGPSRGQNITFVRPENWLGKKYDQPDTEDAFKHVLRRYLAAYSPATHEDFARWFGMLPGRARAIVKTLSNELEEVEVDGRSCWVLRKDSDELENAEPSESVRLLPNFDSYMLGCYPPRRPCSTRFPVASVQTTGLGVASRTGWRSGRRGLETAAKTRQASSNYRALQKTQREPEGTHQVGGRRSRPFLRSFVRSGLCQESLELGSRTLIGPRAAGPFLLLAKSAREQGISIKRTSSYPKVSGDIMGKVMISLSDEAEQLVRQEVDKLYYGRTGGVSIFFEGLVRRYFDAFKKGLIEKKSK